MTTFYKIFLIIFVVFIAVNLYAIDWNLGVLHAENNKFLFSIVAGIIGLVLTFVMNTWRKLSVKQ